MQWLIRFSGFVSAALVIIVLAPSLQSFYPAEAIRSHRHDNLAPARLSYKSAPTFRNAAGCAAVTSDGDVCDPSLVHVALTVDLEYLRGSIAAVHSIMRHASCPEDIFFHFIVSDTHLKRLVSYIFPELKFKVYYFDPSIVRNLISTSVRQALEQPLNYARNYLAEILEPCVHRVIYFDSDLVLVDDVAKLWRTTLGGKTIGAPEFCRANFTKYFTNVFWSNHMYSSVFADRTDSTPCYFNTGVMVIDLDEWRRLGYTRQIERWMEVQKKERIYELGSLPPFLLVFAGHVAPIDHGWNQHGLGGDNVRGSCRDLHPGRVSLLHWSGSGKPWVRLDSGEACPLDKLWEPYDLFRQSV